ncbi:hypothetical protein [Crenobacter cavernae]|uniref:Phage tail protein n=1 Tax=Crenobacter cavernae TaxID=2290923 RepID=A0ABY0FB87_9NEIS|nr:hypothetical protein [Crenobacter cavernae]RXZ42715.1 hypothetical protein EBB06_12545 [Crenobacter cavernae]
MPLPTFPPYARILRDGYDETPDFGVQRTEMDGGLAKQRPRYSTPIVTRAATLLVEHAADKRLFDDWFRAELAGGAGWFSWTDPVDGVSKSARVVDGKLQWKPSAGRAWLASTQLETLG